MKEVSEFIYGFFTGLTELTDVVGTQFFPVVADADVNFPFAVYNITQQEGYTKDSDGFEVSVTTYFEPNKYDDCVTFSDTITDSVKTNRKLDWQSSNVVFIDKNQSIACNINFKIEQ